MNTELLKSKLLEAAFNGSLTHADTSKWEFPMIGDIAFTTSGGTPEAKNKEFYEGGTIKWIRSGELGVKYIYDSEIKITQKAVDNSSAKFYPVNSVLIALYGATVGKVAILKAEATSNQAVCAIFPNERFDVEYMYYFLRSQRDVFLGIASGGAQSNISQAKVKSAIIPLPSIEEQKHIVSTLEEGFAAIDAIAAAKENLSATAEMLRSKILQAAFDGSLTGADISTWKHVKLNEVCIFENGYAFASSDYKTEGTPLIRISNIRNSGIDLSDAVCVQGEYPERFIVHKGDLLIAMSGATTGKMGIYNTNKKAYLNQRVGKISIIDENILLSGYRNYFLRNQTEKILNLAYGAAQPNISAKQILDIVVPIPPHDEQKRIVAKIEELFAEIDKLTK